MHNVGIMSMYTSGGYTIGEIGSIDLNILVDLMYHKNFKFLKIASVLIISMSADMHLHVYDVSM